MVHVSFLLIFFLLLHTRAIVGEFDQQGSGGGGGDGTSPVCARQPRTLSMAIVPGEHIRSILLAKQQRTTQPQLQPSSANAQTQTQE